MLLAGCCCCWLLLLGAAGGSPHRWVELLRAFCFFPRLCLPVLSCLSSSHYLLRVVLDTGLRLETGLGCISALGATLIPCRSISSFLTTYPYFGRYLPTPGSWNPIQTTVVSPTNNRSTSAPPYPAASNRFSRSSKVFCLQSQRCSARIPSPFHPEPNQSSRAIWSVSQSLSQLYSPPSTTGHKGVSSAARALLSISLILSPLVATAGQKHTHIHTQYTHTHTHTSLNRLSSGAVYCATGRR